MFDESRSGLVRDERRRRIRRSLRSKVELGASWRRVSRLLAESTVEETAPLGGMDQPPYLNQMVLLETALEPRALLAACQAIERSRGRVRTGHWGARTLDLDIVRFGHRRIADPDLIIPHPELGHRDFWTRELAELEAHER